MIGRAAVVLGCFRYSSTDLFSFQISSHLFFASPQGCLGVIASAVDLDGRVRRFDIAELLAAPVEFFNLFKGFASFAHGVSLRLLDRHFVFLVFAAIG